MSVLIKGLGVKDAVDPKAIDFTKMPLRPYPYRVPRVFRHMAKGLAGVFYEGAQIKGEVVASGDQAPPQFDEPRSKRFREHFPSQRLYVAWCWPLYVRTARAQGAMMLGMPHISEHMKQEIYEALREEYDATAFQHAVAPQLIGLSRQ